MLYHRQKYWPYICQIYPSEHEYHYCSEMNNSPLSQFQSLHTVQPEIWKQTPFRAYMQEDHSPSFKTARTRAEIQSSRLCEGEGAEEITVRVEKQRA